MQLKDGAKRTNPYAEESGKSLVHWFPAFERTG